MPEETPANETVDLSEVEAQYPSPNYRMIGVAVLIGVAVWAGIIWFAWNYGPSIVQSFQ